MVLSSIGICYLSSINSTMKYTGLNCLATWPLSSWRNFSKQVYIDVFPSVLVCNQDLWLLNSDILLLALFIYKDRLISHWFMGRMSYMTGCLELVGIYEGLLWCIGLDCNTTWWKTYLLSMWRENVIFDNKVASIPNYKSQ